MRDAICGHTPEAEGDKYEKPTVKDMANALKDFPRYKVALATPSSPLPDVRD